MFGFDLFIFFLNVDVGFALWFQALGPASVGHVEQKDQSKLNQYEGVPTAGVDTPYAHDFDEGEVHQLKHNHTDYLVRYDLRSQSAATFKVLLVDEQHVILFNVEPEAEKEGCEKGHDGHRDTEK